MERQKFKYTFNERYYKNAERCVKAQEVLYHQETVKEMRILITLYKNNFCKN